MCVKKYWYFIDYNLNLRGTRSRLVYNRGVSALGLTLKTKYYVYDFKINGNGKDYLNLAFLAQNGDEKKDNGTYIWV